MNEALRKRLIEIFKFGITGGICFLIDFGIFYLLKNYVITRGFFFLSSYQISTALSFTVSVIVNYLICIKWVFQDVNQGDSKTVFVFILTSVIGLILNMIIIEAVVAIFKVAGLGAPDETLLDLRLIKMDSVMFAKIVSTLLVMIWNYITKRMAITRQQPKVSEPDNM